MKGMNLNVNRSFVSGQFLRGQDVATARPQRLGLLQSTPKTLALFNHTQQNHLSTGVTRTQFDSLSQLSGQQHPVFTDTHRSQAEAILTTAGVDFQDLSTANKVKAAVMLGGGEVNAAWMRENIQSVVDGDQDVIGIGKMLHSAYVFAHEQQVGGLQDPSASFHTKLALDIAEKAIAQNGTVDTNMVDELINQLQNDTLGGTLKVGPHRAEMIKLLQHISANGNFRDTLESITAPGGDSAQAKTIRATINKPNGGLTNRDTRKAVLSSMLSHLRQGAVGSCFGTSIAIHLKTNHYNKTLGMLKELVENNRMQGTFQRSPASNPVHFHLPGNHNALDLQYNHEMKFNKGAKVSKVNGQVLDKPVKLYDIPGIIQGLSAIGITDRTAQIRAVTDASNRLASSLFDAKKSPKELLANIIDNTDAIQDKSEAKKKAGFAFHATMENRLMRSFEYTLSGFAETQHAQTLGTKLSNQIDNLFMQATFTDQNVPFPLHVPNTMAKVAPGDQPAYGGFLGQFTTRLSTTMKNAFVYKYDPELVHGSVSRDGHSSHGGFTIQFTNPTTNETSTITSPAELASAVKAIFVHQTTQDMITIAGAGYQNEDLVTATHSHFMREIFEKVNIDQLGGTLIARTEDLQGNPVGFTQGADPAKVVRNLFTNDTDISQSSLAANAGNDGKTVLTHVLTTLRAMQSEVADDGNDYSIQTLENTSIPMSTTTHAFLLRPDLSDFLTTQMDSADNISDKIDEQLKPDVLTTFADTALDRQQVLQFVDRLSGRLNVDKSAVKRALRDAQHTLKPNDIYRSIYAGLPNDGKRAVNAEAIGFALAKAFDAPTRPVIFADTNWGNGDTDIHFGIVHNPFTNKSEMWSFAHNGQEHTARSIPSQKNFVQSSWDIFNEPHQFGF